MRQWVADLVRIPWIDVSNGARHRFFRISYIFDTSKCATNYIISFEVYDGFIGQKILKL